MTGLSATIDGEEPRLLRLLALVLDDLAWSSFVTPGVGEIRVSPGRERHYSPLVEALRSVSAQFVVMYPSGDGQPSHTDGGDLVPNDWDIAVVVGEKTKPVTWVDDTWADSEILVKLADGLQNTLLDFTTEACPPCPVHHRHPLNVVEVAGEALWVCPSSASEWRCPVGEYKAAARRQLASGRGSKRRK